MEEQPNVTSKQLIDPDLLAILCCPETKQGLTLAGDQLVERLNSGIDNGTVQNKAGQPVTERIDGGLVRTDGKVLYPIREQIPIMLIEEGIVLED